MALQVDFKRGDSVLSVFPSGRLDGLTVGEFEEQVRENSAVEDQLLLIDFSSVEYISSAGLRVLLILAKSMGSAESKFALCALSDSIMDVFRISGFDQIMSIYKDREEALASI